MSILLWVGTSDHQLATLCNDFPGFFRYASLMEEAADAERRKASRPYDVPELHDSLKDVMAALLVTAATLERSYQEALDADKSPEWRFALFPLPFFPLAFPTFTSLPNALLHHPTSP